jgi:hypothetical protein
MEQGLKARNSPHQGLAAPEQAASGTWVSMEQGLCALEKAASGTCKHGTGTASIEQPASGTLQAWNMPHQGLAPEQGLASMEQAARTL